MTQTASYQIDMKIEGKQRSFSAVRRWSLMLCSMFVIVALVEPAYITELHGTLHQIFRMSKYIAAGLTVLLFIARRIKLNGLLAGCLIFEGTLFFSTLLNASNMEDWLKDSAYTVVFLLYLQTVMEIDSGIMLRALSAVLGAYVNINSLCKIVFPNGLYTNSLGYRNCWLLGYDNAAGAIIVVAITISFFRILLEPKRLMLWDWSVVVSGVWFTFTLGVANAIVAESGFFLLLLLGRNPWIRSRIGSMRLITVCMIGLFLLIHLFSVQQGAFFSFFIRLLNKSTTFSSRTFIWEQAWNDLAGKKLLFGFGIHDSAVYILHFGRYWAVHLHCYYLQVLYEGGLVAFGALFGWILYVGGRFDKTEHRYCAMAALAGFLAVLFMWQVEASNNLVRYFIIILFLLYNVQKFETQSRDISHRRWRFVV